MSFDLRNKRPLTESIMSLELIEEDGKVKMVGYGPDGARWTLLYFLPTGKFQRVAFVPSESGCEVDGEGKIVEEHT